MADPVGSATVRIVVISAYELTRRGLGGMLTGAGPRYEVLDTAPSQALRGRVDLALLDLLALPELTARGGVPHLVSATRVLGLEAPGRADLSEAALNAGVLGLVPRSVTTAELAKAVDGVVSGQVLSVGDYRGRAYAAAHAAYGLTPREVTVLALVAAGMKNQGIAEHLFLSINSVKTYIRSSYGKIGARSRSEAVLWAVKHNLADADVYAVPDGLPAPAPQA